MSIAVFVVMALLWFVPVWLLQGSAKKNNLLRVVIALIAGAGPCVFLTMLGQGGVTRVLRGMELDTGAYLFWDSFIGAALIEEGLKFLTAWLCMRGMKSPRRIDCILIYGAVGLGFNLFETLLGIEDVLTAVYSGLFPLHLMFQMWMGCFCYDLFYGHGNKLKWALLAFAVPFITHGLNDYLVFTGLKALGLMGGTAEETVPATVFALVPFYVYLIVFEIVTMKRAVRAAKEVRPAA